MNAQMMNITLSNPLSDEIHEVQLPVGSDISTFETMLYHEVYPDVALGTLEIRRIVSDIQDDEVAQLMIMGESLTDQNPHEVTELFDGIELMVFVNPFLLRPSVYRECAMKVHTRKGINQISEIMTLINVAFHHPTKMITEESNVVSSVDLVYDGNRSRWASYYTFGKKGDVYYIFPTEKTVWFSSLSKCLSHVEERIPKQADLFEQIERLFHEAMQKNEEEWDDEDEEADAWGRAVDAREDWYENHFRWQ